MSLFKKIFALAFVMVLVAACQQKQNKRVDVRSGRGLRGSTQVSANSVQQCGSYSVQGKFWGEITSYQSDQAFMQELQILTSPVMRNLPAEDQLGYVSGTGGQYTGVRFWGTVGVMNAYGNGMINPNVSEIRLEIFDDNACKMRSDGTVRPVIPVHIGAGQPGFAGVEGYVNGGSARVTFMDNFGAIILEGQISGNVFSGIVSYTLNETGGQPRILGRFQVPANGFFVTTQ